MGNTSSKTRKNFIYQSIYKVLALITPLITAPYISRVIGAESLGVYSYSLSIAGYFVMIAYLGVDNYGCRSIAQCRDSGKAKVKGIFSEIYTMQLCSGLIALAGYCVFLLFKLNNFFVLYVVQGIALFTAIIEINWYFTGTEKFSVIVTLNIIVKILTVLLIVLLVKSADDLVLYAFIMTVGAALSQFIMWAIVVKEYGFIKLDFKGALKHVKPNLVLFIPVLALSVYHYMDKIMLGALSDFANSGYYYNADKLVSMPLGLITGLGIVMLPRMSNLIKNSEKDGVLSALSKTVELNCFLASSMAFGIAAISDDFVPFFFGAGYDPCILLTKVFAPILIIKSFSDLVQMQFLIPNNSEKIYIIATFGGAFINLILNVLLIPSLGALGATLGTLGAEAAVLTIALFMTRKQVNFMRIILKNSVYFIAGIIMFFAVQFFAAKVAFNSRFLKTLIEILIGVAVYFIILIPYWFKKEGSIFHAYVKRR